MCILLLLQYWNEIDFKVQAAKVTRGTSRWCQQELFLEVAEIVVDMNLTV